VRLPARRVDPAARVERDGVVAEPERDLALEDVEELVECVPVERRPLPGALWDSEGGSTGFAPRARRVLTSATAGAS
jgi:hypothetical protein